jgi:hypothetical protein
MGLRAPAGKFYETPDGELVIAGDPDVPEGSTPIGPGWDTTRSIASSPQFIPKPGVPSNALARPITELSVLDWRRRKRKPRK